MRGRSLAQDRGPRALAWTLFALAYLGAMALVALPRGALVGGPLPDTARMGTAMTGPHGGAP